MSDLLGTLQDNDARVRKSAVLAIGKLDANELLKVVTLVDGNLQEPVADVRQTVLKVPNGLPLNQLNNASNLMQTTQKTSPVRAFT